MEYLINPLLLGVPELEVQPAMKPVTLGIDIGATKMLIGYVTEEGTVYKSKRFLLDFTSQASTVSSIYQSIDEFLMEPWEGSKPSAIGIGLVGHVDPIKGIWKSAINIPINNSINLSNELSEKYHLPVAIDNDVNAATLAEHMVGDGRKYHDFLYLNVGTGIATGIVSQGQLIRGIENYSGELGHMSVDYNGETCVCGRKGCLENIASGRAIIRRAQIELPMYPNSTLSELDKEENMNSSTIFEAAEKGDVLAISIKESTLQAIGTAIINTVNLLNPEAIILGGGVFRNNRLIDELRDAVIDGSLPVASQSIKHFASSTLDVNMVGLIGAGCLGWREKNEINYKKQFT
jgi:glucokinase